MQIFMHHKCNQNRNLTELITVFKLFIIFFLSLKHFLYLLISLKYIKVQIVKRINFILFSPSKAKNSVNYIKIFFLNTAIYYFHLQIKSYPLDSDHIGQCPN